MKSLQAGFMIPPKLTKKVKMQALKLTLNAENFLTITKYEGMDPDIGPYANNILLRGVDWGNYPLPKTITLGLNASF